MRYKAPIIIMALLILPLATAAGTAKVTGEQVIAKVKRQFDMVNDYRVDASLSVKGPNISVNNMEMTIYYKKPGKMHVDAKSGMAMIPQGNFFGNPINELSANAKPVLLKTEKRYGSDCYVVRLDSTSSKQSVTVWVDKKLNVVRAASIGGNVVMTTVWTYEKVAGKYYMPIKINAEAPAMNPKKKGQKIKVTVEFNKYVVNKGIDDKIFEEAPKRRTK